METFFNDLAITTALGGPCSGIDSALDNEEVTCVAGWLAAIKRLYIGNLF
jgi:hypothetical protein